MGSRGRKSAAELSVASESAVVSIERPVAPSELTDEQKFVWQAIVNSEPADWFTKATRPMLAQYCRHVIRARRLAQLIDRAEQAEEVDIKEYRDLLRSEEEQSRAIASLATKMRLSQQSTYDRKKPKGKGGKKPWED